MFTQHECSKPLVLYHTCCKLFVILILKYCLINKTTNPYVICCNEFRCLRGNIYLSEVSVFPYLVSHLDNSVVNRINTTQNDPVLNSVLTLISNNSVPGIILIGTGDRSLNFSSNSVPGRQFTNGFEYDFSSVVKQALINYDHL